jgi:hypothetical protein
MGWIFFRATNSAIVAQKFVKKENKDMFASSAGKKKKEKHRNEGSTLDTAGLGEDCTALVRAFWMH